VDNGGGLWEEKRTADRTGQRLIVCRGGAGGRAGLWGAGREIGEVDEERATREGRVRRDGAAYGWGRRSGCTAVLTGAVAWRQVCVVGRTWISSSTADDGGNGNLGWGCSEGCLRLGSGVRCGGLPHNPNNWEARRWVSTGGERVWYSMVWVFWGRRAREFRGRDRLAADRWACPATAMRVWGGRGRHVAAVSGLFWPGKRVTYFSLYLGLQPGRGGGLRIVGENAEFLTGRFTWESHGHPVAKQVDWKSDWTASVCRWAGAVRFATKIFRVDGAPYQTHLHHVPHRPNNTGTLCSRGIGRSPCARA